MTISRELAHGAAKWWADNLKGAFDNGDALTGAAFAFFSSKVGGPYKPTPEERQSFEDALTDEIFAMRRSYGAISFGVDYSPDDCLVRAADAAGFGDAVRCSLRSPIPIKTHMNIFPVYAVAGLGYGGEWKVVAGERPTFFETEVEPGIHVTTESYDAREWTTSTSLRAPSMVSRPLTVSFNAEDAKRAHDALVERVRAAIASSGLTPPTRSLGNKRLYEWTSEDAVAYREQRDFADKIGEVLYGASP